MGKIKLDELAAAIADRARLKHLLLAVAPPQPTVEFASRIQRNHCHASQSVTRVTFQQGLHRLSAQSRNGTGQAK
jgi:hypothetical protein